MKQVLSTWLNRYLSTTESVYLLVLLLIIFFTFATIGKILTPILAGIIIAYLLMGGVKRLTQWKCPHILAVSIVMLVFVGLVLIALIWLIPLLWQQLTNFFNEVPKIFARFQQLLAHLPQRYPTYISAAEIEKITTDLQSKMGELGQLAIAFSLSSIPGVITFLVYFIIVPLLAFFFLSDSRVILTWSEKFIPKKHDRLEKIWSEINAQLSHYVRGRVIEILIVGTVSAISFGLLGLKYAILLGALVGLSVIVPYVGAVVVTIPILIVGYWQWGFSAQYLYLIIIYAVIITLDANVLVPLLFSGAMKMPAVTIILALIFFGGLWGFWGVFFAIPLATVVKALINHWPVRQ